ncbi:hypothetical protein [Streptomyces cinereoruber]|uniref:hypothetical protein n=1 Tax=Streptomyces cinereoruber TaxID=67260 RepID=UPI003628CE06
MRVRGRCPSCGTDRLLPGRDAQGQPLCRDCAGITRDFFCSRCGFEGLLLGGRLCEHCTLSGRLTGILDDGTGRPNPRLLPLHDLLVGMDRPKGRLVWLNNPQVPALLRDLATGNIALTHEAIQQVPNWRTAAYLRDLLMECGVLPRQDRRLLLFQRWLAECLAATTDPVHEQLLRHFAHWHQLRKLQAKADVGPLSVSTVSRPPRPVPSSPGSPIEAAHRRR